MNDARSDEVLFGADPTEKGVAVETRDLDPSKRATGTTPPLPSRMDDIGLRCEVISSGTALFRFVL